MDEARGRTQGTRTSRVGPRTVYFSAVRDGKPGLSRAPATGGAEERVVGVDTGSVVDARESADGRTLFFKAPWGRFPLFAHPFAGGPDRKVLERARGRFGLAQSGVYSAACTEGADAPLHHLDLTTGRDRELGILEKYANRHAVSPDGETILYVKVTASGSDLMLVEGFR